MASDWRRARGRFVDGLVACRPGRTAHYLGSATGCTQAVGPGRAYEAGGRPGHAPGGGPGRGKLTAAEAARAQAQAHWKPAAPVTIHRPTRAGLWIGEYRD